MREIKFRAWLLEPITELDYGTRTNNYEQSQVIVEEAHKMIYAQNVENEDKDLYLGFDGRLMRIFWDYSDTDIEPIGEEFYILMQSTGLKDKNGVEIYEGDIVKVDGGADPVNVAVGFEYGCYVLDNPSWVAPGYTSPELKYYVDMSFISVEVIGNIYENPELLSE